MQKRQFSGLVIFETFKRLHREQSQDRQWYILSRDDSWRVSKFIVQAPILNQLFLRYYNVHIKTTITYISCHRTPIIALYTERENNTHLYTPTLQCWLSFDRLSVPVDSPIFALQSPRKIHKAHLSTQSMTLCLACLLRMNFCVCQ